jgi:phosphoribosyl-ATP pyrophosphohydrolase
MFKKWLEKRKEKKIQKHERKLFKAVDNYLSWDGTYVTIRDFEKLIEKGVDVNTKALVDYIKSKKGLDDEKKRLLSKLGVSEEKEPEKTTIKPNLKVVANNIKSKKTKTVSISNIEEIKKNIQSTLNNALIRKTTEEKIEILNMLQTRLEDEMVKEENEVYYNAAVFMEDERLKLEKLEKDKKFDFDAFLIGKTADLALKKLVESEFKSPGLVLALYFEGKKEKIQKGALSLLEKLLETVSDDHRNNGYDATKRLIKARMEKLIKASENSDGFMSENIESKAKADAVFHLLFLQKNQKVA